MKRWFILLGAVLFLQISAIAQSPGLYVSPFGGGATQWSYYYPTTGGAVAEIPATGMHYSPSIFATLNLGRLMIGVEGSYSVLFINNLQRVDGVPQHVYGPGLRTRQFTTTGGKLGITLFRFAGFRVTPNASIGTFNLRADDFGEAITPRYYTKLAALFEFRVVGILRFFAEPSYMNLRYRNDNLIGRPTSHVNNLGINIGMGIGLP